MDDPLNAAAAAAIVRQQRPSGVLQGERLRLFELLSRMGRENEPGNNDRMGRIIGGARRGWNRQFQGHPHLPGVVTDRTSRRRHRRRTCMRDGWAG